MIRFAIVSRQAVEENIRREYGQPGIDLLRRKTVAVIGRTLFDVGDDDGWEPRPARLSTLLKRVGVVSLEDRYIECARIAWECHREIESALYHYDGGSLNRCAGFIRYHDLDKV